MENNTTTTCSTTTTTTISEEINPNPPAFSRKPFDFNHAATQETTPAASRRPRRQKRLRRKRTHTAKKIKVEISNNLTGSSSDDEEEEEEEEFEEKFVALQRIVPGGESLGADKLFEETADYILALQFQVKALKFLTSFVEGSEKERRKLGG